MHNDFALVQDEIAVRLRMSKSKVNQLIRAFDMMKTKYLPKMATGELTAAAVLGGVPHPPGFPVFAILARLFAALPFGPCVAWRVNLLSAVSTAAAAGVLCAVAQRLSGSMAAGFLAAALFGTNPIVWHNATAAEVFGLNAFFVALALWLWQNNHRNSLWRTFIMR